MRRTAIEETIEAARKQVEVLNLHLETHPPPEIGKLISQAFEWEEAGFNRGWWRGFLWGYVCGALVMALVSFLWR